MDESEKKPDALPEAGRPSENDAQKPSSAKTFTEAEVNAMIAQRHSKLDKQIHEQEATIKRLESDRQALTKAVETNDAELEAVRQKIDEAELSKVRSDPKLLQLYQEKKDLEVKSRSLAQKERELNTRETVVSTREKEINAAIVGARIAETAVRHKISVPELEDTLKELGISDPAKFDRVAATLAKGKGPAPVAVSPDSGLNVGGGEPTVEQLEKMTPEQYKEYWDKRRKR